MTHVTIEVEEHEDGWAYKLGDVFSERFATRDDAMQAATLSTVLQWLGWGGTRHGFFVPYVYASTLREASESDCIEWFRAELDRDLPRFMEILDEAARHNARFRDFRTEDPSNVNRPRFNQDWFPGLDAAIAYTMVRKFEPKAIVEIGSGHSTRFMRQAIEDGGLETHLHSIDPVPRRDIDAICDRISRTTVDRVPVDELTSLQSGDVLFIDGSHVTMPGTDVDYLFSEVVPCLQSGIIVHVHDIFLPYGYPDPWRGRRYNEQLMLLALLAGGDRYQVLFPNAYMRRNHSAVLEEKLFAPLVPGAVEGGFWMKIS